MLGEVGRVYSGEAEALRRRFDAGRPLLLDAATGTELARRGVDTSPPLWSARGLLDAPDLVRTIHAENAAAGAEILTIASFRLHGRNLQEAPPGVFLEDKIARIQANLISKAVALAREAAAGASVARAAPARSAAPSRSSPPEKNGPWVAGSLAPLEDCYLPDLVPPQSDVEREHREMAEALAAAGCDLILVETMNTVRELLAAASAALRTSLPVVASMVTDGRGRLLSGEPIEAAALALLALPRPPDALGVNCIPARAMEAELGRLAAAAPGVPLVAYANTGRAIDERAGLFSDPIGPRDYAGLARGWLAAGARLLGGCCGTTSAHTAALKALLDGYGK